MKFDFTKYARPVFQCGRVAMGGIGVWISTMVSANADWTLQSSERLETASPLTTLVRKTVASDRSVEMHVVFFDVKRCALRVVDHPDTAGNLETAMLANNCLAGVNGNYFHPDRTPLGLVISGGKQIHALERARLLSGILAAKPGHFALLRFTEFAPDASLTEALQAGPFLVDRGETVAGLQATRRAERTVVLSDGKGKGALLVCHAVTLAEMAGILTTKGVITEMTVARALNLDGGSSTGMWVNAMPKPLYLPELGSVRNYLALVPREK